MSLIKSKGVAAGTVRAKYSSMRFFLKFLRKHRIFAGLTMDAIQKLEITLDDVNAELKSANQGKE